MFSTSGGKGKSPGINTKPPLYIIPVGNTLAETLKLSWWLVTEDLGIPAWEKPNIQLPNRGKVSLLTGLTWLPRRVWFDDPEEPESPCISCGQTRRLIRKSVFAGIGSSRTEEDTGRNWHDPHVIYVPIRKKQTMQAQNKTDTISLHAADALKSAEASCGQWARIIMEIAAGRVTSTSKPNIKLWVVGFSTVQNDKYLEAFERIVPLSDSITENDLKQFEWWNKEGFGLSRKIKNQMNEPPNREHAEVFSLIASIRPQVENQVSNRLSELLTGGDEMWKEAASEYKPMMKAVAGSLSPGYTTEALKKRNQISGTLPDMNPPAKPDISSDKKKGGSK